MTSQEQEEQEKGAAVMHVTRSAFPADHLSPWMSNYNYKVMVALAKMNTIARIAEKADKNAWTDAHPGQPLPDRFKDGEEKDEKLAEEFDYDVHARGAAAAYGYGVRAFVQEVNDRAVSVNQVGRRQAIALGIGAANRSGAAGPAEFETPPKKHFWSRPQKSQVAGLQ